MLRISVYLRPLGPRTGADLERRSRRDTAVPAAFNHTRVQEGITGPIGKLYAAPGCFEVVVVEATATGRAKISVCCSLEFLGPSGMLTL